MAIKSYNFRLSAGYVTDGPNQIWCGSSLFPTTDAHGLQSGWVTDLPELRDRDDTLDPRLAGTGFANTNDTRTFRVTLPQTGSYDIRIAVGEVNAQSNHQIRVLDNATAFISILDVATGANEWRDATNVLRTSAADWIANNVAVTRNFTSTTLNLQLGPNATGSHAFAHLSIEGDFGDKPFFTQLQVQVI